MGIDLGKIMVTPRGDYQDYVEYDRLDLVAYQGSSYIALKPVEGITPSDDGEYWQLHGSGAYQCAKEAGYEGTEEEFRAAQAGMAGHMKEKNPHGTTASDVGAVPSSKLETNFVKITHEKITTDGDERVVSCYYLTDTLYWRIDVQRTGAQYRLIDNGEVIVNYTAKPSSDYLPLTGGTLSGTTLNFYNGLGNIYTGSASMMMQTLNEVNGTAKRKFVIANSAYTPDIKNAVMLADQFADGTEKYYYLFGEHNKPTATYTGNSTSGTRQIVHNGIGYFAVVQSDKGTVFATPLGGLLIQKTGSVSWLTNANLIYKNGVLTINTTDNLLNASGTTYTLYCI